MLIVADLKILRLSGFQHGKMTESLILLCLTIANLLAILVAVREVTTP